MGEAVEVALATKFSASTGDLTVRLSNASDLEALVELFDGYRVFYGQASDVERARGFVSERIAKRESVILVAQRGGALIGFTQLYPSFTSVGTGRTWILNDLFVQPTVRRAGVGRALVLAASELTRRAKATAVSLSTAITNTSAQALYEALGFQRDTAFYHYRLPVS